MKNNKVSYIIIEDEPIARRGLLRYLSEFEYMECVGMYSSVEDALLVPLTQQAHVAFVDIHLPQKSGVDFASQRPDCMQIVFTTAYADYAVESYELGALDYLLKPISKERLKKTMDKINTFFYPESQLEETADFVQDHVFIKVDRKLIRLEIAEIAYIEGMKDYVIVHTDSNKKYITALNMKTILTQLPKDTFMRINKSYAIHLGKVDSLDSGSVFVNGFEITIGGTYKEQFMKRIDRNILYRY